MEHGRGFLHVLRKVENPRKVGARTVGNDPQAGFMRNLAFIFEEPIHDFVDGAVSSDRHNSLRAGFNGCSRKFDRVAGTCRF